MALVDEEALRQVCIGVIEPWRAAPARTWLERDELEALARGACWVMARGDAPLAAGD